MGTILSGSVGQNKNDVESPSSSSIFVETSGRLITGSTNSLQSSFTCSGRKQKKFLATNRLWKAGCLRIEQEHIHVHYGRSHICEKPFTFSSIFLIETAKYK